MKAQKSTDEILKARVPLRFAYVKVTAVHRGKALLEFNLHEPIVPLSQGDRLKCDAGEFLVVSVTHSFEWTGEFSMIQHLQIHCRPV